VATFVRNVTMGLHMAAFLEQAPCDHAVYIGSDAIYHDAANPVRETSCASPTGYHGLMHLVREHMLGEAARRSGCPLVTLRPSLLYGARDTHNGYGPNRFLRTALQQGKIVLFGEGEERRDHVNIGDFSRLIELCLLHRSTGAVNVATGEAVSFGDVARLVARVIGRPVAIEGSPRANPITHRHFDITALLKAFPGFSFTPLEVGLTQALGSAVLS
jgi:nucleoside-diphosphate-sugar epimerase